LINPNLSNTAFWQAQVVNTRSDISVNYTIAGTAAGVTEFVILLISPGAP
jgi:hypothetical protein